jgi:hypothetical protein
MLYPTGTFTNPPPNKAYSPPTRLKEGLDNGFNEQYKKYLPSASTPFPPALPEDVGITCGCSMHGLKRQKRSQCAALRLYLNWPWNVPMQLGNLHSNDRPPLAMSWSLVYWAYANLAQVMKLCFLYK